jgi:hypothetical protein
MGLQIAVRGEFHIDPPLKWVEVKNSRFLHTDQGGTEITDVVLQVTAEEFDDDEGVRTVITCNRVVPWTASPYDPRNLLENMEELRAECTGHTVTGQMILYDIERVGYVSRIVSDSEGVREERALLIWPDGSEADPLY